MPQAERRAMPDPPDRRSDATELELLGAPRVRQGQTQAPLRSRKALVLLGILAVDGRVPRSRIASLLWSELDPERARRNLRRELHRLREAGCGELVLDVAGALSLAPGIGVDVQHFRDACAHHDVERALELYRGAFLAGLDDDGGDSYLHWLSAARETLAQQFREVVQQRIGRCRAEGQPRQALRWQLSLIDDDALQEQHFRVAMQLHAELGERESALQLYERCKTVLGQQLGLRPMPETTALAERIRSGQLPAGTEWVPHETKAAASLQSPDDDIQPDPLIGRAELLRRSLALLRRGQAVLLRGEAGIGKTRLASACAGALGRCVVAIARPSDAGVPYAAATRLLRAAGTVTQAGLAPWSVRELARLLPELGPAPPDMHSATDSLRLAAAIDDALHQARERGLRAIVFDDWHHADDASLRWWSQAIDAGLGASMAVLFTARMAEQPGALLDALQAQCEAGRVVALDVEAFAEAESADLLASRAGAPLPPVLAARLHQRADGNPFFLLELLGQWLESGHLRRGVRGEWLANDDLLALPLPPSVRDAVLAGLAQQDEAARRLLEAASIAGDPFSPAALAQVCALTDWECVAAAERAVAARMLVPSHAPGGQSFAAAALGAGDGELRFRHDLLSQTLAAGLPASRRRLLHRRLADALERDAAAPERIARHLEQAGANRAAVRWRVAAAQAAERVFEPALALTQYDAALANQPGPDTIIDIQLARVRLLMDASRRDEADGALVAAAASARDSGKAAQRVRVQLATADHWRGTNRVAAALALVDNLLEDGDVAPQDEARALEERAFCLNLQGHRVLAQAAIQEALARVPRGAGAMRARLHMALGRAAVTRGEFEPAGVHARKAAQTYELADMPGEQAAAIALRGAVEMNLGRYARAVELLEEARQLAAQTGRIPTQRMAILNLVKIHTQTGAVDRALALLADGEALSPHFEHPTAEAAFLQARYYCHYLKGELAAALALAPNVVSQCDRLEEVYWHVAGRQLVADLYILTGDLDAAQRLLEDARARCLPERALYQAPLIEIKLAWIDVLRGRPQAALARMAAGLGIDADRLSREARDARDGVQALAHLRLGDPAAGLSLVPAPNVASTCEIQALQWACRVEAEVRTGGLKAPTRKAIAMALAEGRLPALESLVLRRALAAADPPARPGAHAAREALLGQLAGLPQEQARLARTYPPLLPRNP